MAKSLADKLNEVRNSPDNVGTRRRTNFSIRVKTVLQLQDAIKKWGNKKSAGGVGSIAADLAIRIFVYLFSPDQPTYKDTEQLAHTLYHIVEDVEIMWYNRVKHLQDAVWDIVLEKQKESEIRKEKKNRGIRP